MNMIKGTILGLAGALLATPVMAEDLDVTRKVASDATVTVINVAGEIGITTWDRDEVHLTGYTDPNAELEITESAQGIHFEVRELKNVRRSGESVLNLVVPVEASIITESVSADITIENSRGASVSAESVSGDVEVSAHSDRVDLVSVSGDVTFEGSASRGSGETVSGDIDFRGISGEVSLNTVSGDAQLDAGEISSGKFETVSGSLELSLEVGKGGRLTVESMSGDVSLALPSSQEGEFKAQSFSGDIRSRFGRVERGDYGPGSHLKYVSGNNGAVIRIESFSGDIQIGHR